MLRNEKGLLIRKDIYSPVLSQEVLFTLRYGPSQMALKLALFYLSSAWGICAKDNLM